MKSTLLTLIFLFGALTFLGAQANLSVQGTLQKSTGVSVEDGEYSLTFKLYTTETGGTPVWSETQPNVNVIGGVYSVTLGSVNPLSAAFDQPYFLGITLGSGAELTPRAALTSSPYALSLIGQDNVFPSTGAVGAGTSSPAAGFKLHVNNSSGQGKMLLEGTTGSMLHFKKDTETAALGFNSSSDNTFRLFPGNNQTQFFYGNSAKFLVDNYGTWTEGDAYVHNLNFGRMKVKSDKDAAVVAELDNGSSWIFMSANENTHSYLGAKHDLNLTADDGNAALKIWYGGADLNRGMRISGTRPIYISGIHILSSMSAGTVGQGEGTYYPALTLDGDIVTDGLRLRSDRRIKKDMKPSDAGEDIATLMGLQVTDYRMKDSLATGNICKKGFIAQEVEAIFPRAVSREADFIPDIYAAPEKITAKGGQLIFELQQAHQLSEKDELMLYTDNGSREIARVSSILSDKSFSVEWSLSIPEKAFIYGKKVNDVLRVDYDQIHNLNVSVTQELVRRIEQLERENAVLRTENETTKQQYEQIKQMDTTLKSDFNVLNERLLKLENLLSAGVNR
jgi:hypothetical protein